MINVSRLDMSKSIDRISDAIDREIDILMKYEMDCTKREMLKLILERLGNFYGHPIKPTSESPKREGGEL